MKKTEQYQEAIETYETLLRYKVETQVMIKLNDKMMFVCNSDSKSALLPLEELDFIFKSYNTEFLIEIIDDRITKPLLAAKNAFLENICAGPQFDIAPEGRRENVVIIKDSKIYCTGVTLLHAGIWCASLKDTINRVVVEN